MRKKLIVFVLAVLIALSPLSGNVFNAKAAGALSLGSIGANSGFVVDGTADGKTKISWNAAARANCYLPISGDISEKEFIFSLTPDANATLKLRLAQALSPWGNIGSDLADVNLTANIPYDLKVTLSAIPDTEINLFILLDEGESVSTEKSVVIDELSIDGVSYTPTVYVPPSDDPVFDEIDEWEVSDDVTVTASALDASGDGVSEGIASIAFDLDTELGEGEVTYISVPVLRAANFANLYVKYLQTGIASITVYQNDHTYKDPEDDSDYSIVGNLFAAWNVSVSATVPRGFFLSAAAVGTYISSTPSSIIFVIEFENGAEEASLEFAGMAFGASVPEFATDIGDPEFAMGDWGLNPWGTSTYDVEINPAADGALPAGVAKVSYDTATDTLGYIEAQISNYWNGLSELRISYYATETFILGIDYDWSSIQVHTVMPAGSNTVIVDLSAITLPASFALRLYIDFDGAVTPGEKEIVFTEVVFREPLIISSFTQDASRFTIDEVGGNIEVSYPQKNTSSYNCVIFTINNWTEYDRFLNLYFTTEVDFTMAIYLGNSTVISGHTLYKAGVENVASVDLTEVVGISGTNEIRLFFDTEEASLANTVTFTTVEVSTRGKQATPAANSLTINYTAETMTFAAEYEVSSTNGFESLIASGSAVTPGNTYYIRKTATADLDQSLAGSVTAAARPVISTVPANTVTGSSIKFTAPSGYRFKNGDGEWNTTGEFTGLNANTDYAIKVQKLATVSAFASAETSFTIKTSKLEQGAPEASVVVINYKAETLSFDSAYEVSAGNTFATLIISGAAVTPGATLYVRLKETATHIAGAATTISVPARPAALTEAPAYTVTNNSITVTVADGMEYKIGTGAWSASGEFTELDAASEYRITVRTAATDTAFASSEFNFTVTTSEKRSGCGAGFTSSPNNTIWYTVIGITALLALGFVAKGKKTASNKKSA